MSAERSAAYKPGDKVVVQWIDGEREAAVTDIHEVRSRGRVTRVFYRLTIHGLPGRVSYEAHEMRPA